MRHLSIYQFMGAKMLLDRITTLYLQFNSEYTSTVHNMRNRKN